MPGYERIVVLTGAGISAESGVKTFRDNGGLWESHSMEEIATPEGFAANPALVQRFYNDRRRQLKEVVPNKAHLALAEFEKSFDGEFLLVTQNVDDLHERAGSQHLLHMHGELRKVRCLDTDMVFDWKEDITEQSECDCCQNTRTLRPHIVWFGEMPLYMEEIYEALETCDLFISIGTSGHVYPAAGFVQIANQCGAHTVEINLEPSNVHGDFAEHIQGPAGTQVPEFLRGLLAED
ncbi:MAG: Sir2 family NAD+-dependent deacetylase [Oceanobacter sp.]